MDDLVSETATPAHPIAFHNLTCRGSRAMVVSSEFCPYIREDSVAGMAEFMLSVTSNTDEQKQQLNH